MPYKNELANKASHFDIVKNPEVSEFIKNCDYIYEVVDGKIMERDKAEVFGELYSG